MEETAQQAPARDLARLMRPASIAVVGATDRPGSYAAETLLNLETIGFPGPVWGVNPRRTEVLGRECVPSIADLPLPVDAVVVAIPAAGVAAAVDEAGVRGCGGAVVFGAGFGEVASGAGHHADLVAAADRHGLPVCGPNCNGIVSPIARIALWGDSLSVTEYDPTHPSVALVSQSGNVAVNALATRRGLRFHTVVASGNQAVLSAADYLEFIAAEDGVGAVALYLEDDGGPRLLDGLAACAEADLPVVVLKVGESPAGVAAAAAHSGALAGDQRVFRAVIREAGAVWGSDVHELLELAKTIAVSRVGGRGRPRPEADGLAIMTCSGGDSVANPLDYTAMIWGDVTALGELVRTLGEDPAVGQVLVFYDQPHGMTGAPAQSWQAVRDGVTLGASLSPVPTVVASTLPELLDDAAACEFAGAGIPAAAGLRTGLRCSAELLSHGRAEPARVREIAAAARTGAGGRDGAAEWLAEHAAKAMLREGRVPVPPGRLVSGPDDAVQAWRELGGPVAVKLNAAAVQHKTELGGVVVGLDGDEAVRSAYQRIAPLASAHGGSVLVERMGSAGLELIVAAHRNGIVPALMIGLGGVWTELLDDVVIVPLPADARRIERAIGELRGAALLYGARGRPAADVPALAGLAQRVGELLLERDLETVECNPVLVAARGDGATAVDAAVRRGRDD
ncbi:MAG TPA: acetate--CoA ligase family protein [Solirubrobacteraceae bacterium]|nr:acetate--CoA ligase family protein [Solirubrobacteraceae bacterium]